MDRNLFQLEDLENRRLHSASAALPGQRLVESEETGEVDAIEIEIRSDHTAARPSGGAGPNHAPSSNVAHVRWSEQLITDA